MYLRKQLPAEYGVRDLLFLAATSASICFVAALVMLPTSGLIHSDDSQIVRSSSSSRHESRNCCERHTSRPPSA